MMKRELNIAENWERAYDAFQQINFKAWDYESVKQSLLDYLKLYYPEDFNDFIETSDMVMIIEIFAYIAELLAYRIDLNSHENFLTTAERKESVLRLAKFLSYNASRTLPARGLVKVTSIRTTETVIDSLGNDLTNRTIRWNDSNNPNWKEQFILVMNRVLQQEVGTVLPTDRRQVQDVLFELYQFDNDPIPRNTIGYNVSVSDQTFPMELVSSTLTDFGPKEQRPEKNQKMGILYLRDGLGDSSDNTGFFFLTKQGQLRRKELFFDGVLPNQKVNIDDTNINDTDVWLNNIDSETGFILTDNDSFADLREGEWEPVDVANTQNVLFNVSPNRNKYEIETRDNDSISLIFGDGNFSSIPRGKFELWYRVSDTTILGEEPLTIPKSAIQNTSASFGYTTEDGKPQTFGFTFSLFNPIQNSAPNESIERIRAVAPSVYYTQDRMVNGRDYNEFMLKDNSILKLRSINRTFAGDSKYIGWHDPKEYYENVKIFGDDLTVYFETKLNSDTVLSSDLPPEDGGLNILLINSLIFNHIQPILTNTTFVDTAVLNGVESTLFNREFTNGEINDLFNALSSLLSAAPNTAYLTYNIEDPQQDNNWSVQITTEPPEWWISVESQSDNSWIVTFKSQQLIMRSDETRFFINNSGNRVITYDTLNSNLDEIVILKANVGSDELPLERNYRFAVLDGVRIENGINSGLCNYSSVIVLPIERAVAQNFENIRLDYLIPEDGYVYFFRETSQDPWQYIPTTPEVIFEWENDQTGNWKRERGVEGINFLWLHRTPRYHLIDPAPSNIIDAFVISRGYYADLRLWLTNRVDTKPPKPTAFQLRNDYGYLIDNKMISDTLIIQPGDIKVILGSKANPELQAFLKIVRSQNRSMSDNSVKVQIVQIVNEYFDINQWEFGQPFYFTDLASRIHNRLRTEIDSVVLVPRSANHEFGTLFQVIAKESEIIQANMSVDDIEIVETLDPRALNKRL